MATVEQIEIEIVLDDGSVIKGFQNIEKAAKNAVPKGFGNRFTGAFKSAGAGAKSFASGLFSVKSALLGLVGAAGAFITIRESIEAAAAQQDAINALNTALKSAGTFSLEASEDIQEFAKSLQATTKFGDEVILQQAALARNFVGTNEEAKKLTQAAIELSAATGISLDSAVKNLGKSYAGLTGELGESVPIIRSLTAEQLKAGGAVSLVLERFGGSAAAQIQTFSGSIEQLRNTFGDFLETIGDLFIRSPLLVKIVGELSKLFLTFGDNITKIGAGRDIIGDLIRSLVSLGLVINDFVIRPLEILTNVATVPFKFISAAAAGTLASVSKLGLGIAKVIKLFKSDSTLAADLEAFSAAADETLFKRINALGESISGVFDSPFSDGAESVLSRIQAFANSVQTTLLPTTTAAKDGFNGAAAGAAGLSKEMQKLIADVTQLQQDTLKVVNDTFFNPETFLEGRETLFGSLAGKSKKELESISAALKKLSADAVQQSKTITDAVNNGLGRALANGVQASVNALIKGENAFEAFAKSVLGVFGDLAIQLGSFFIVQGIAVEALNAISGTGAIAAGVALVALGTLLKSFSGGDASTGAPGTAASSPLAGVNNGGPTGPLAPEDVREEQRVNVVIQGSVFDTTETGIRIADIISDQFGAQGVKVTT